MLKTIKSKILLPNILCDFDGVITDSVFPDLGTPIKDNIRKILEYRKLGHKIVIFTTRSWWEQDRINTFCIEQCGFEPDAIICGKPMGILVDDLAVDAINQDLIDGINDKVNRVNDRYDTAKKEGKPLLVKE